MPWTVSWAVLLGRYGDNFAPTIGYFVSYQEEGRVILTVQACWTRKKPEGYAILRVTGLYALSKNDTQKASTNDYDWRCLGMKI